VSRWGIYVAFLSADCPVGSEFDRTFAIMRLLTHNMLSCNIKGVTKGFPLGIEAKKLETKEADFNPDFLRNMFTKLDWKAFHDAALAVGVTDIPEQVEPALLEDTDFLQKFHHALLEVHLEEGALICPETGRRFPVTKGVPNMLLHEDEV
jgi:multifunctional methyltransferase subunit TRM112